MRKSTLIFFNNINTALTRKKKSFFTASSNQVKEVAALLYKQGYISGFHESMDKKTIFVHLKYMQNVPAITKMETISTPSKPVTINAAQWNNATTNTYIISTSAGVAALNNYAAVKRPGGLLLGVLI